MLKKLYEYFISIKALTQRSEKNFYIVGLCVSLGWILLSMFSKQAGFARMKTTSTDIFTISWIGMLCLLIPMIIAKKRYFQMPLPIFAYYLILVRLSILTLLFNIFLFLIEIPLFLALKDFTGFHAANFVYKKFIMKGFYIFEAGLFLYEYWKLVPKKDD